MDPVVLQQLSQLKTLADAGIITPSAWEAAQTSLLTGAPPPGSLPADFRVEGSVFGGGGASAAPPQRQLAPAPQQQAGAAPAALLPSAEQMAAQAQLAALREQQEAQLRQMRRRKLRWSSRWPQRRQPSPLPRPLRRRPPPRRRRPQ